MSLEYRPEQRRLAVLSFTAKLQPRTRLGKMLLSHLKGNTKLYLASLLPHHHHHPRMLSARALVTVGFASPAALPLPQQWLSWPQIVPSLECSFCWSYSFIIRSWLISGAVESDWLSPNHVLLSFLQGRLEKHKSNPLGSTVGEGSSSYHDS